MSKILAAALTSGFLIVAVCLISTVRSVTARPPVVASQTIRLPDGTMATIYLPPDFDPSRTAWTDIDQALKEAAVDHEPVLIDFGSSWCPYCVQLEQSLQAPPVQAMARSLHIVRVDTGPQKAQTNTDIGAAYGLELNKIGIPGLVLLSAVGKIEATSNDSPWYGSAPSTPSEIIDFLKPHL